MISKLCEYNRRTEFIIHTIYDHICVENIDKNYLPIPGFEPRISGVPHDRTTYYATTTAKL